MTAKTHLPSLPPFGSSAGQRPCHGPLPARALPHRARRRTRWTAGLALPIVLLVSACGGRVSGQGQPGPEEIERRIARLIELCTPLEPTLTSDHHDRQLHERRALQAELAGGDVEVGRRALAAYGAHSSPDEPILVRVGLLEVAAHAAPAETRPLLVRLITEYGHHLADRTESVRLLAETSPEVALEVLKPLVTRTRRTSTLPDDEFLIRGYVTACDRAGVSPVPVLADFVTNIYKQEAARHYAAEALGDHGEPLGIKALEVVLIESTGNGYLRRKAAQSLRKVMPPESACVLFHIVADREADTGFLEFMVNMILENCS